MKSVRNILFAFILNFCFAVFEFIGGVFTGSVAILSDAIHDMGDAVSIGISLLLEKKSKKEPNNKFTYGYTRYSVIGSVITTLILLFGSVMVTINAVIKIFNPSPINYDGMIIFAVVGVIINFIAALLTSHGESLNQRAVNLHMLEDVLGWVVVLIGAIVMRFTDISIIDPIMSIGVALFIFINALKTLLEAVNLFLEKTPRGIDISEIKEHISKIEDVLNVHHVHVWSLDGGNNYATMHIVTNGDAHEVKEKIREKLEQYNICHVTLELESSEEHCHEKCCHINTENISGHHHHHHHHH